MKFQRSGDTLIVYDAGKATQEEIFAETKLLSELLIERLNYTEILKILKKKLRALREEIDLLIKTRDDGFLKKVDKEDI